MLRARNILIAVWILGCATISLVFIGTWDDRVTHAIVSMGVGLFIVWVSLGGLLSYAWRDKIKSTVTNIRFPWKIKFVAFCTLLALIEEAITTTLTNMAPLLNTKIGEAYITASTNYLEVVLFHSVIIFIPMFIAWAWVLSRYEFNPNTVTLLFGITGWLSEAIFMGPQNLLNPGLWIPVYGLMIYLPTYALEKRPETNPPKWQHYLMAIVLPYLCAIPVAAFVNYIHHTATFVG